MKRTHRSNLYSIIFGLLVYLAAFTPVSAQVFVNEATCEAVGDWDAGTDTCTLTGDVNEPLVVDTVGVTVNGNGYAVNTESDWNDSAVYINAQNVTISNLRVMSPARYGIRLTENADVSVVEKSSISGSFIGVFSDADYTQLEHVVLDSELSELDKRMFVGVNISNADNGVISYVTTRNLDTAIVISFTDKTSITNSSFMAVDNGIEIDQSEQVTITDNSFFDIQKSAIVADEVAYLTVSNNLLKGNQSEVDSSTAIIFNNTTLIEGGEISHNRFETWGSALDDRTQYGGGDPTPTFSLNTFINILMSYVSPRIASAQSETTLKIIENDFVNIAFPHTFIIASEPYVRFSSIESEGNYWDVFDEPGEGCLDENVDSICDDPYQQTGPYLADMFPVVLAYSGNDPVPELPLNLQAANNAVTLVNQPDGYLWGGKGWDFNLAKFVPASTILSGYSYYNPDLESTDTGIGVDCSGLVAWAYNFANDAGKSFVNNFIAYEGSAGQATDAQSVAVEESDLRPGDTLYFDFDGDGSIDHTAMYVGDQGGYDVVNAGSPGRGIVPENLLTYTKISGFKYFRRPSNPKISMAVQASSPVDLVVTDPDGNTIEPTAAFITEREYIREIPGELYYSESVQGHDGNPSDIVYSPNLKSGQYTIKVVPDTNAEPNETYSLSFTANDTIIELAKDEPISDIPSNGFAVLVTENGIEVVEPSANLDELWIDLKTAINESDIRLPLLKSRLMLNYKLTRLLYEKDKRRATVAILTNLERLIERRTGSGIVEADAIHMKALIREIIDLIQHE